jgi:radical SAM superfamily enzyme YgiQ (UPF0313 family)
MAQLVLVNHWTLGINNSKPPLGLAYLASYLREYLGYNDISIVNTGTRTFEKIAAEKPEVVGFTCYSVNYYEVEQLMKRVKTELGVTVLLGGPHISSLPTQLSPYCDIGVIGEGEETLLELMRHYLDNGRFVVEKLASIAGLLYREKGELKSTPPRELINPLDKIPLPARDLLDMDFFMQPSPILKGRLMRGTTMISSRGCPFKCIYCHVMAQWGNTRMHSAERVVDEMEMLVHKYGAEGIYIEDDLFISNYKRINDIITRMKARKIHGRLQFFVDLRANMVTERLMAVLEEMGVAQIAMGLESGSEPILQYLKGENVSVADNYNAIRLANKYGIGVYACFMIGAIPETREDLRKTQNLIRFVLDNDPKNSCQVNVTTPLPGTKMWDEAVAKGYISEAVDWSQWSLDPNFNRKRDFYINEHIPFEEFQRLAAETAALCNSQRLKKILRNFSFDYVKRAAQRPRVAYEIVRDYLKFA